MQSEGFYVNENSLTPAGFEPAPIRFVAQHLNHCATTFTACRTYYSEINREIVHLVGFTIETIPSSLRKTIRMLNQSVSMTTITFIYDNLIAFNRLWSQFIVLPFKADSKQLKVHLLDISTVKMQAKTRERASIQLFSQFLIALSWTPKGFLYAKSHLPLFPPPFVYVYISPASHQVAICYFSRLKLQFFPLMQPILVSVFC